MRFSAPKQALLFSSDSEAWSTGTVQRFWKTRGITEEASGGKCSLSPDFQLSVKLSGPPPCYLRNPQGWSRGLLTQVLNTYHLPACTRPVFPLSLCLQSSLPLPLSRNTYLLPPSAWKGWHPGLLSGRVWVPALPLTDECASNPPLLWGPVPSSTKQGHCLPCLWWEDSLWPTAYLLLFPHLRQGHSSFHLLTPDATSSAQNAFIPPPLSLPTTALQNRN